MNKIDMISSPSNEKFKKLKSLSKRKYREEEGRFIVEGIKMVEECLDRNYFLDEILVSQSFLEDRANEEIIKRIENLNSFSLTDKLFSSLTETKTPQGILATSKILERDIKDCRKEEAGFYLFLDGLQDPGNMGTIIRTADAFGVSAIFIKKGSVDPYNPKVVRATMGSIFRMPLYKVETKEEFLGLIDHWDVEVYATSLEGKSYIQDVDLSNSILIIGNESKGVSEEYQDLSSSLIKIPMTGDAESLNAAVASSIIMYEAMRQRIV